MCKSYFRFVPILNILIIGAIAPAAVLGAVPGSEARHRR